MENINLTETVKAAQSGDKAAMETLYHAYAKPVYYLALKLMKDRGDAEDVTQEVFIYVFQKIAELQNPAAFPVWLNRIAASKCTDQLRKRRDTISVEGEELAETDFFEESDPLLIPEKSIDYAETARMIVEIVDSLPTPQRLCVYYYYYEHLTVAQIAEILSANESTVKNRLALARQKIRKELERLNDEEGIKLYAAAPLMLSPILKTPLHSFELPAETLNGILQNVTTQATKQIIVKGAASTALKTKLVIAITGVAVTVGISVGIFFALNSRGDIETPLTTVSPSDSPSPAPSPSPSAEPSTEPSVEPSVEPSPDEPPEAGEMELAELWELLGGNVTWRNTEDVYIDFTYWNDVPAIVVSSPSWGEYYVNKAVAAAFLGGTQYRIDVEEDDFGFIDEKSWVLDLENYSSGSIILDGDRFSRVDKDPAN